MWQFPSGFLLLEIGRVPSVRIRSLGLGCRAEGKKAKAPFIRIDGDTPPSERQRLVNDFQQQAGLKVAILSIKAAGTGLTLTVRLLACVSHAVWMVLCQICMQFSTTNVVCHRSSACRWFC